MSGLVGRGAISFKKQIVAESLIPALGIKKVRFAHQNGATALAANSSISFSTFSAPSEMTALGFTNPSSTEITNLRLGQFRNNVQVESNLNGVLLDQVAYTITDDAITFINNYTVNANEIFVLTIDSNPVTCQRVVDARPLRASGTPDFSTISTGPVDFSVGQGYRIAQSAVNSSGDDRQQIGNVQVFVDGVLQIRNAGNADEDNTAASSQTGNYREIALATDGTTIITGVDYANAIRFNQFNNYMNGDGVLVVATNLIVDEPNGTGLMSEVDNLSTTVATNTTNIATNTAAIANITETLLQVNEVRTSGTTSITIPTGAVAVKITGSGAGSGAGGGGHGNNNNNAVGGTGGIAAHWSSRTFTIGATGQIDTDTNTTINIIAGVPSNGTAGAGFGGNNSFSNPTNPPAYTTAQDTILRVNNSSGTSIDLFTWKGGAFPGFVGAGDAGNVRDGGNGGFGSNEGGAPGIGSTNGSDSSGGGGGGGSGYLAGEDGGNPSGANQGDGGGGSGGRGGALIEWYSAITSN